MPSTDQFRRAVKVLADHASSLLMERKVRKRVTSAAATAGHAYDAALYFADDTASLYQVRQWLGPMSRLARKHPVAVLCHRPSTAAALLENSPIPIYLATGVHQVEEFTRTYGVKVIFYVNNNQANFSVLRLTEPNHIHLSHGESDKVSMASNQLKAYDYCFIAGEASRRRITSAIRNLRPGSLVEIGRPQLDDMTNGDPTEVGDRTTVLYAPTWEGDRPAMAYGSLVSHGLDLVQAILGSDKYRLIFRPHPRSGTRLSTHRKASERITAVIEAASKKDPAAGHYVDRQPDSSVSMRKADVCICDISAMAMDWLPRRKPLLLTRPVAPEAAVDENGIASVVPLLDAAAIRQLPATLQVLLDQPVSEAQMKLIETHFGDITPGASTQRFIDAVAKALRQAGG